MNIENKTNFDHPRETEASVGRRFATQEVNDVSILFGDHGISRCRRDFYRRLGRRGR
jgi:hypothetical protein